MTVWGGILLDFLCVLFRLVGLFFIDDCMLEVVIPVTITYIAGNRVKRRNTGRSLVSVIAPESFQCGDADHLMTLLIDTLAQKVEVLRRMHPSASLLLGRIP